MFEPWFVYSIISALLFTIYVVLARVILKSKGDPNAFAFLIDLISALVIAPFLVFEVLRYSFEPKAFLVLLLSPVFYALVDMIFAKARKLETVTNISIVVQIGLIFTLLGGSIFLNESLSTNKIIGVTLIVIGNLFALWEGRSIRLSKGTKLAFLAVFLFSQGGFIKKYLLNYYSPAFNEIVSFPLVAFWIFVFSSIINRSVKNTYQKIIIELKKQGIGIIIAGASFGLAILALMQGYQVGEVSKVLPVQNASLILSVLAGMIFLGERKNMVRKLFATVMVFIGAVIIQSF